MYSSLQCCFFGYFHPLLAEQSDDSIIFDSPNPSYMGGRSAGCSKVHPGSLDYRGEEVETVPPCGGDGVVRETRIDVSGHQRTHTDVSVENKIIN